MMHPIEPPDSHRLRAASGWLELGCAPEALTELKMLSPGNLNHPDVLELRWLIQADLKDWNAALETAVQLVEIAPRRPAGWLHRAYALRRVPRGSLQLAWDCLLPAYTKFPKEPVISYNLSCYACQMGQLDTSRKWLRRALRAGRDDAIKQMALRDEDLRALWPEIPGM
jgi:tetratricopeptide (TPR) repeat protein